MGDSMSVASLSVSMQTSSAGKQLYVFFSYFVYVNVLFSGR